MPGTEPTRSLMLQILKTQFLFRQAIQQRLKIRKPDMTFEMLQIMTRIWRQEGVNQQTLAAQTSKDKVSLTYLINNLEKKGWVTRCEDPLDKRNKLIYLTPEGKDLRSQINPLVDEVYRLAGEQIPPGHSQLCIDYLSELDEIFKNI